MQRRSRPRRRNPSRCSKTRCESIPTTVRPASGSRTLIHRNRWDPEPARILARADEAVTRAIALSPNYAHAHYVKAEVLALSGRFDAAPANYDQAIAPRPHHAAAHVPPPPRLIATRRAAET